MKNVIVLCMCLCLIAGSAVANWHQSNSELKDARQGRAHWSELASQTTALEDQIKSRKAQGLPTAELWQQLREISPVGRTPNATLDQGGEDCSDAVDLGSVMDTLVSGTISGATNDFGPFATEPECWQGTWFDGNSCGGPDVTYLWTVPADGEYTFSLCNPGTNYDTGLLLYYSESVIGGLDTECPGEFICGCDDGCGFVSTIACIELSQGEEILIVVDSYDLSDRTALNYELSVGPCTANQVGPCSFDDLGSVLGNDIVYGSTVGELNDFGPFGEEPDCWQGYWYDWDEIESASGPDYAYKWTAPYAGSFTFSLCGTADFGAALLLFHNTCPAAPPAYPNDYICGSEDACSDTDFSYPEISCIELNEGDEVIVVVDGYEGIDEDGAYGISVGNYSLSINECVPCDPICPDGAFISTEHACYDGYVDETNGGCFNYGGYVNPASQTAEVVTCPVTICGVSGAYTHPFFGPGWGDEDWYLVVLPEAATLSACLTIPSGSAGLAIFPVDCPVDQNDIIDDNYVDGCGMSCVSAALPAGSYYVATFIDGTPCNTPYTLDITCSDDPCGDAEPIMVDVSGGFPACQCITLPCGETAYDLCFSPLGPNEAPDDFTITPGCTGSPLASIPVDPCFEDCEPTQPVFLSEFYYNPDRGGWCVRIGAGNPGCFCICLDNVLPVELNEFTALARDGEITLNWSTASETDNDRFDIVRDGTTVGQIQAHNSATGSSYAWSEHNLQNGREYTYTLHSVSLTGTREAIATVSATPTFSNAAVTEYALYQNYPNPFNPETSIAFDLVESGHVALTVYNPLGQTVATLVNGTMNAGRHSVSFQAGELPSGLYFYRLDAGEFNAVKKMVLMK